MREHAVMDTAAIVQFRRDAKLTQEDLAQATGYSVSAIRKLEQGEVKNSLAAVIVDLAHTFYDAHPELRRVPLIRYPGSSVKLYEEIFNNTNDSQCKEQSSGRIKLMT